MIIRGHILDIDYMKFQKRVSILLYVKREDGKTVAVFDPTYRPYFYVLPSETEKAEKDIRELSIQKKLKIEAIERAQVIYNGRKKDSLRIICALPQDTQKIRDVIKRLEARRGGTGSIVDELEYQLGFYRTYLMDSDLSGLSYVEMDVEEVKEKVGTLQAFIVKKLRKLPWKTPPLKIVSFDTEVIELKRGERNLIMISLYGKDIRKVLTFREADYPPYVEVLRDEKELITRFVQIIDEYDLINDLNKSGYQLLFIP